MDRYEVLMLLGLLSLTVNFWLAIWLWSRPVVREEVEPKNEWNNNRLDFDK